MQQTKQNLLTKGRLTKTINPVHYIILLKPNLKTFKFRGTVIITVQFDDQYKTLPKFAIHSKELDIFNVDINGSNVGDFSLDTKHELLIINPPYIKNDMKTHTLTVSFEGTLNDDLKGFYRSKYMKNGKEEWIATTQFESTDARRAFPCFDEPSFKSTYDIAITHPDDKMVLSNSTVMKITHHTDGTITTIFNTTPKMSTYLCAFIVGNFDYIEGFSKSKKRIRVYGLPEDKPKLEFAKKVAIDSLDWYENWFGIPYPLEKMDLIGVPDFNAGAMENWGLITFRPEYLFCTEEMELSSKVDVVVTIAHEIAHQWFGNLVTMEWWNYLWLNESMATYFGWLVCHELFPDWNVWDKFVDGEYNYALELDSLESSHPVEFDESIVENAKDIDQIFDCISYSKGSCLVRGLVKQIGDVKFREGMIHYINTNKEGNTTSSDLWKSFDFVLGNAEDSEESIANLMKSWTRQTGYPVINVKCDPICNCTKISQNKYLKSGPKDDSTMWKVPVAFSSGICGDVQVMLEDKELDCPVGMSDTEFIVNPNRNGFYRVKYDVESKKDLPFKIQSLFPSTQKQILGDMFSLALNGYQSFQLVFDVLKDIDLSTATDSVLWTTIVSNLSTIYNLLKRNKDQQLKIKCFITSNISPHVKTLLYKIGLEDSKSDTTNEENLRPLLLNFLALMKDSDIIAHSIEKFNRGDSKYILDIVAQNATEKELDSMVEIFENETTEPSLKSDIVRAFGTVSNENLIDKVINNILVNKVREQDQDTVIAHLSINEHGTYKVWDFVKQNWNKLRVFDPNGTGMTYTVKSIALGFCTREDLDEYVKFFESNGRPEGTNMVIDQMIERISSKISSIDRLATLELV